MIATGQVGMRKARRLIGLTRHGNGCGFGQRISSRRERVAGDNAAPSATPVPRSHARSSAPPRPCRCRSATTSGSELHVPATSVPPIDDAHRHQRRAGDDRRSFANDPVRRLDAAGGISPRPIPMQPEALSGFVAERAPVKLLDAASIFGSKALDFRHVRLDLGAVQLYRVVTAAGGREAARPAPGCTTGWLMVPGVVRTKRRCGRITCGSGRRIDGDRSGAVRSAD